MATQRSSVGVGKACVPINLIPILIRFGIKVKSQAIDIGLFKFDRQVEGKCQLSHAEHTVMQRHNAKAPIGPSKNQFNTPPSNAAQITVLTGFQHI